MFYDRFEQLCKLKGVKPGRACTDMGLSRSLSAKWKNMGTKKPSAEVLEKMSSYFGISINEILDEDSDFVSPETQKAPTLNKKDERDIKKKMDEMLELFDSADALMFDGEPLDEETRQLLRDSYENQLRLTKQLAKAKFTPKKYREK